MKVSEWNTSPAAILGSRSHFFVHQSYLDEFMVTGEGEGEGTGEVVGEGEVRI